MKNRALTGMGTSVFLIGSLWLAQASMADGSSTAPKPMLETLLTAELEGAVGTDVIVSRVVIPPNTSLPRHWHPGEEFAYVLEGSAILRREGKEDLTTSEGEVIKISLKEIHTAVTTDEGATILVFRVHEHGKPERVLVD
jgi:quercetin dioxygenase-like cupin family protein